MPDSTPSLTVYSDYVCPFCYLGRKSLETYQEQRSADLDVEWHPFDLREHKRGPDGEIDHDIDDGKDETYFEQVRENVARLKSEHGAAEMRSLDEIPDRVDSFDAQAASLYVQTMYPECWEAFDDAVFEALWVDGRDIGDTDVLVACADAVGLPGPEIRAAVSDRSVRKRLRDQFTLARQRDITGVPTFEYEDHRARGVVPPAQLERLVEGPSRDDGARDGDE